MRLGKRVWSLLTSSFSRVVTRLTSGPSAPCSKKRRMKYTRYYRPRQTWLMTVDEGYPLLKVLNQFVVPRATTRQRTSSPATCRAVTRARMSAALERFGWGSLQRIRAPKTLWATFPLRPLRWLALILFDSALSCSPRFRWRTQMDEQRKYAILFAATILAARKLNEIGDRPCQRGSVPSPQSRMPSASSKD